jgi:hypothetical protein
MTTIFQKESILEMETQKNDNTNEKKDTRSLKEGKREFKKSNKTPQEQLEDMVQLFMSNKPYEKSLVLNHELEVRFGTRGIKPLNKIDYNNVIQKIKSLGFTCVNEEGSYMLRIQNEFLDSSTGRFKLSNIRTEIRGFQTIQDYCKHNDLKKLMSSSIYSGNNIDFHKKMLYRKTGSSENVFPVNFDDFNFRVSYQTEEQMKSNGGIVKNMIENWEKSKKIFRYINRVTFAHPEIPIQVDISIVKNSTTKDRRVVPVYTTSESEVFENPEVYEIELEVNNSMIGPGTLYQKSEYLLAALRKSIKYIMMGLQGTNYPISYPEQAEVLQEYMRLIHLEGGNYNPDKRIYPSDFIGPSSYTLQIQNIVQLNDNNNVPNIRKDYSVTEKADGERHLMFISKKGKIYLLNTNMKVLFTGAETENFELFNSIIDGEIILHDKHGKFINLYAAFDVYFKEGVDVRKHGFTPKKVDDVKTLFRLTLLKELVRNLKPKSVVKAQNEQHKEVMLSPIRIECKKFYWVTMNQTENVNTKYTIFTLCNAILEKERQGLFEYNTDGLIFTPENMGVGADRVGKTGPLTKSTWDYSFKWKPPQFNTIDFLVTTKKSDTGSDLVTPIFQEGTAVNTTIQFNEYKTIILRCGFDEKKHGFLNPCQDVIEDKLPSIKDNIDNEDGYKPVQFFPTDPYDPTAGITNIMLEKDDTCVYQMFTEEREVFSDNTIVEFRYEIDNKKEWNWIPLRVRFDKTNELRQGLKNFGNAYHVANSNWHSIHKPITEEMICTGKNIPDEIVDEDVYYNRGVSSTKTRGLRDFHNLYVKKTLITQVSKKGNTLIDYACGKGGDFPKWIRAKLSFVFGIDISKDNLENRIDGACARFLKYKKTTTSMPYALFVNGNSSANIRSGAAMLNDKAMQITRAVFGEGPKNEEKLGKGVFRQYGVGESGFDISSCQFALHYFFENQHTFQNYMRNLAECTKLGGYFIGTSYDGKKIFNLLKNKKEGESETIYDDDVKVWEIQKEYSETTFEDDVTSLGYKINVYQESINKMFSEYLINFDYLDRILENYGFRLVTREEAKEMGLPNGTGMFQDLYNLMVEEWKRERYDYKHSEYEKAISMTAYEKKISFLNRYFVYKKIAHVNAEKVSIELMEEFMNEGKEKKDKTGKTGVEKKTNKTLKGHTKPKVKKLTQMLVLEDNEENVVENEPQPIEVEEEKIVEEKEEIPQPDTQIEEVSAPVKKTRKPYTKKLKIGKDTDIKDIENIEEPVKPTTAKKVKSKSVNFVIEE